MPVVYVNIGSNLGNKQELIKNAVKAVSDIFGYYCLSEFVVSEPWGFESTNRFFNIGMAFKSDLHPEEILKILQKIEKSISRVNHRHPDGHYKDREIDIDIMAIDRLKYQSERLSIPHPHLLERNFFINPLKELSPDWEYPE